MDFDDREEHFRRDGATPVPTRAFCCNRNEAALVRGLVGTFLVVVVSRPYLVVEAGVAGLVAGALAGLVAAAGLGGGATPDCAL